MRFKNTTRKGMAEYSNSQTEEQPITEKIVLAYSGGLDTSVLIKYLQEKCSTQVITVTVDVGQGEDLQNTEKKLKKLAF